MKLGIIAVGRAKQSPEQQLVADYFNRLPHPAKVIEVESKLPSGQKRMQDEGARMLTALKQQAPHDSLYFCLDPYGSDISSENLAELIGRYRNDGHAACYFAIGGADGHSQHMLSGAKGKLAFGKATWPHMLCRVMLAEQLYRAEMILKNHPYHHG